VHLPGPDRDQGFFVVVLFSSSVVAELSQISSRLSGEV